MAVSYSRTQEESSILIFFLQTPADAASPLHFHFASTRHSRDVPSPPGHRRLTPSGCRESATIHFSCILYRPRTYIVTTLMSGNHGCSLRIPLTDNLIVTSFISIYLNDQCCVYSNRFCFSRTSAKPCSSSSLLLPGQPSQTLLGRAAVPFTTLLLPSASYSVQYAYIIDIKRLYLMEKG